MKSLFSLLAIIASAAFLAGFSWIALALSAEGWRYAVGTKAAAIVRNDDTKSAKQYLDNLDSPWWLSRIANPIPSSSEVRSTNTWLTAMRQHLDATIESESSVANSPDNLKLKELRAQQTAAMETQNRLTSRYRLLSAGTSELFHLEVTSDEPKFYRGGLLAGLPVLNGLNDEIQTLPELSAVVTAAGGVVTVAEFAKALDGLLVEGRDLQSSFERTKAELTSAKSQEIELQRTITTKRRNRQQQLAEQLEAPLFSLGTDLILR